MSAMTASKKTVPSASRDDNDEIRADLPDLTTFPKKQADSKTVHKLIKELRPSVERYIHDYNVPFPVLR